MLNRLAEVVLTRTHNLRFGAKIRKIDIPLHTLIFLYKSGFKGVYMSQTCYPDDFWGQTSWRWITISAYN